MSSQNAAVLRRGWRWQAYARPLAWGSAAVSMLLVLAAVVAGVAYAVRTGDTRSLLSHQLLTPFLTAGMALVGALVAARRPRNPIGWLFLLTAILSALSVIATVLSLYGEAAPPGEGLWLYELAMWLAVWVWVPAVFLPTVFVFLYFPDGKLPSPRWRPLAWASTIGLSGALLALAFHPGPLNSWGTGANPYGIEAVAPALEVISNASMPLLVLAIVGSLVSFVARYRRYRGVERQQMKWLLYAGMLMVLGFVLSGAFWFAWPNEQIAMEVSIALSNVTILGIAVAAAIAILRYRLYDIGIIISNTLVYGGLTAMVVGLYVLVVGGAGALLQAQDNLLLALLATGLVAVLFQPVRERLQRSVNRLVYGERDDPYAVLAWLGQRLETTLSPEMVYPAIVETVAETLKLPYVAIAVGQGGNFVTVESYGRPTANPASYPLTHQGLVVGQLLVAQRSRGETFTPAEDRLLRNIARQAGAPVHAVRLTADLQRSRQQLVTSREEERRRLRRDLHDGLGPTLAALHLQAGVLRRLIATDPEAATALVEEFRSDIRAAVEDIRRVVYALRPPALDELGLVAAVQAQAERCNQPPPGLQVEVEAPEMLPSLPAAVEVAAYRIVQEALANVVHHARATHCCVRLALDERLAIEVTDDGAGLPAQRKRGVGLVSMRERAVELGGTCHVGPAEGGGTKVVAYLPLLED